MCVSRVCVLGGGGGSVCVGVCNQLSVCVIS